MTILADRVVENAGRPAITTVFGAAVGLGARAIGYGIARGSVAAGRPVLLVDASSDAGIAAALCSRTAPVLLDLPDDPARLIDAPRATDDGFDVVAAARPDDGRLVTDAERLGRRIERLAAGYAHVVVALDSDPDFDLMVALARGADGSVLVVDVAAEADPASVALVDKLAGMTPQLLGLVLVSDAAGGAVRAVA